MRSLFFILLFYPICSEAKVNITENNVFYSVNAKTKETLLATINNATPIREDGEVFHGHTKWNINWRFWWKSNSSQCRINKVEASLILTLTMPKLVSTDEQVKQVWSNWYPNLLTHEIGHINLAKATIKEIEKSLLAIPTQSSCQRLEQTANTLAQQKMTELSKASKKYDRETNHGESQGAWLYSHL